MKYRIEQRGGKWLIVNPDDPELTNVGGQSLGGLRTVGNSRTDLRQCGTRRSVRKAKLGKANLTKLEGNSSEPAKPEPFPAGALVHLRSCPHGEPGRVQGMHGGRVIVRWEALRFTGRYCPDRLLPVTGEEGERKDE